jgi:hypothetical protein
VVRKVSNAFYFELYLNVLRIAFEPDVWGNLSMINLDDLEGRESITTHLPLPVSEELKERYRHLQNILTIKKKRSLHSLTREHLTKLLDELEAALNKAG